jgi:hypothetical protein
MPDETIIFRKQKGQSWRYDLNTDRYEIEMIIEEKNPGSWSGTVSILDKEPSEPCQNPEECDYAEAEYDKNGIFRRCKDCDEKNWYPKEYGCGGLSRQEVIPDMKKYLWELSGQEGTSFFAELAEKKWKEE